MGYQLKQGDMEQVFDRLTSGYDIYGPVRMKGEGIYSDRMWCVMGGYIPLRSWNGR